MKQFILRHRRVFHTLSNEHRINILFELYEGPKNWSDMMYKHRINPKSMGDHLTHLFNRGYVEKTELGYVLTQEGRDVCELTFLKSTVKEQTK